LFVSHFAPRIEKIEQIIEKIEKIKANNNRIGEFVITPAEHVMTPQRE